MELEIYRDILVKRSGDLSLIVHHNNKKIIKIIIFKDKEEVYVSGFFEKRKANKLAKRNGIDNLKDYLGFILNRYKIGM